MLDKTLSFLLAQLNEHLAGRYPSKEPHAVLSSLMTLEVGNRAQGAKPISPERARFARRWIRDPVREAA